MQRRFVSDVSHELRTPLTTVRMAGDVLHDARERFDPPTARAAELLQNELDRFEMLLADLLEISRFDAGAAVLDLEDVNLVDVAHRVVESTRALAERARHRVVVRAGRAAVRRGGRRPPGRADRPQPGHQRHRLRRQRGRRGAAWRPTTRPPRWRSATTGSGSSRARRRWCSTGSGGRTRPGPAPPAAPGSGCRSRWRTRTCTAAGCRPGGSPAGGAQFRLTLPRRAGDRIGSSPLPLVPQDARAEPARRRPPARRTGGRAREAPGAGAGGTAARGGARAGCVGLPASGPVRSVVAQDNSGSDALVDYTPRRPGPGQRPDRARQRLPAPR